MVKLSNCGKINMSLFIKKLKKFSDGFIFFGGTIATLVLCWSLWRVCTSDANYMPMTALSNTSSGQWRLKSVQEAEYNQRIINVDDLNAGIEVNHEQNRTEIRNTNGEEELQQSKGKDGDLIDEDEWENSSENFYADSDFTYAMGKPIKNWDRKRQLWLKKHPHVKNYTEGGNPRIFLVTGSQSGPCKNPIGDHLLLRLMKNKMDYCRLHGLDMFYNTLLLDPQMITFWAKIPMVRAAMVAHPEAEWIWWIDSDAAITDMEFEHPMEKYRDFNLVVHGWEENVYEKRSWLGINAGVFLIRNCEWSMEFMKRWSVMGPGSPLYVAFAKILSDVLPDRAITESDDQSALVYLMIKERAKWGGKIYIENSYYFHGYWLDLVGSYENISERYESMEAQHPVLKRRYGEKTWRMYAGVRERYMKESNSAGIGERRPFVTHFTGCQPCSGNHNKIYKGDSCWIGLERALDFADDQVLRFYGFRRHRLQSARVTPIT